MFICRYKESPTLPKPLHIHDRLTFYADILRAQEQGYCIHDVCFHPGVPFQDGDPQTSFKNVLDVTRAGAGPSFRLAA